MADRAECDADSRLIVKNPCRVIPAWLPIVRQRSFADIRSATLLPTPTPECCPSHQSPGATDGKNGARCEEPRHHLGTWPWVFRAVAWKIEQVDRYPEKAEQHDAGGSEGHIGKDGEDTFAGHADTMSSAKGEVMRDPTQSVNVRFTPQHDIRNRKTVRQKAPLRRRRIFPTKLYKKLIDHASRVRSSRGRTARSWFPHSPPC